MTTSADRYERLDVIGSGGMATVWRARDTLLGRTVAMKRPHPAPADSKVHRRFARESQMAATVSHPNLVTIFDVGTDDDGPFLIMEFVDAPSLAATTVRPDDVVIVGSQIAAGVAALHAAGIVHRDIKPANVLIAQEGAKLTDFGIARSLDSVDLLTQTGVVHATPAYAAPEVLARGEYSPAADVYSIGMLLLELVTGEPPTAQHGTRVMVADQRWAQILGPALSETPSDRPTAAEIANQLTALSTGQPGAALPPTTRLAVGSPAPTEVMTTASGAAVASDLRAPVLQPAEPVRRRSFGAISAFAVLALVVVGVIALAARRPPSDLVESVSTTPAAPAQDSTPPVTELHIDTTLPPETVPPETVPPDTVAPEEPPVAVSPIAVAYGQFVDFMEALPRDEIKSKEARDIVEKLDEAIAAASDGDADKAIDKLIEAAKGVDKQIESDADREAAFGLLLAVVDSLGLDRNAVIDELD